MNRVLFSLLIISGVVLLLLLSLGAVHVAAVIYVDRVDPGMLSWREDPAWRPLMIGGFPLESADSQSDLERAFGSPIAARDGSVVWGETTSNALYASQWNVDALVNAQGRVLEVSSSGGIVPQTWVQLLALCAFATFVASAVSLAILRVKTSRAAASSGHV